MPLGLTCYFISLQRKNVFCLSYPVNTDPREAYKKTALGDFIISGPQKATSKNF